MKSAWKGAGSCTAGMASGSAAAVSFSGALHMREEFVASSGHTAIYSLHFSTSDTQIDSVRIRFHDFPRAKWNGLGPRASHEVHGRISLDQDEEKSAFALDGRFLHFASRGTTSIVFGERTITLDLELPAQVHLGYAHDPQEACALWHRWRGGILRHEASPAVSERRVSGRSAAGLLSSLSFSGAEPAAYHRLNRAIARDAAPGDGWKIADLLLCQPDIALPPEFRRELARGLVSERSAVRAQNRYAKIRAGFGQYWEFCERQWAGQGIPALAHPSLIYGDERAFSKRDDILCSGPDLIFSPNLTRGGDVSELVLPPGRWIHVWTSRVYPSGTTTVHAPSGNPALFYRAESEYAWLFDSIRQIASRL